MTDSAPPPLAVGPRRMALLAFHPAGRHPEGHRFADAPVGYVLVLLRHGDRLLMTLQRRRKCWELPGGGIEPGETPRAAAVRELWEETGQRLRPEELRFAGYARTALGEAQRVLYGALFTASTARPEPFVPNEEVSRVHWRLGDEPLPGGPPVQTVDEYLAGVCGP